MALKPTEGDFFVVYVHANGRKQIIERMATREQAEAEKQMRERNSRMVPGDKIEVMTADEYKAHGGKPHWYFGL